MAKKEKGEGEKHEPKVGRAVPLYLFGAAHCCEGVYDCTVAGTIYKTSDTSVIGFFDLGKCPPTTTLGDGSSWVFRPGTCTCK